MKLLSKQETCARFKISPAQLARWEHDEDYAHLGFPKRVQIGFRVYWLESEIDAWIEGHVAKRDAHTGS